MISMTDVACGLLDPSYTGAKIIQMKNARTSPLHGPFLPYDDGYNGPSLFTEVSEMLEACILIHPMAELRRLARAGSIRVQTHDVLKVPISAKDMAYEINRHKSEITTNSTRHKRCSDALKTLHDRHMKLEERKKKMLLGYEEEKSYQSHITPTLMISFEDRLQDEELIFSIGVNHKRRRITICFQGSVTNTGWASDFDVYMKEIPNQLRMHNSQPPFLKIHHKLYDYLYCSKNTKDSNGEDLSECQHILQERVIPILMKYPGYKLYVTGHSFGAALATVFAYEAASQKDSVVPKPVTCVSLGSPYVGDDSFSSAHKFLEEMGKLRHIRVSNDGDLITNAPKMSMPFRLSFNNEEGEKVGYLFRHCGLNLRLFGGGAEYEISSPNPKLGTLSNLFHDVVTAMGQSPLSNFSWNAMDCVTWPHHSLREYNTRLSKNENKLKSEHLNAWYGGQDIDSEYDS